MTRSHRQTHQAGRHLAVAEALLRGYAAEIQGTQRYINVNGRPAAVMVAGKGAWMIDDIDKFTQGTTETYVLVDVTEARRQIYVVPGDELRRGVRERHEQFMTRVGTRPRNQDSRHSRIEPPDVAGWEDRWSLFGEARPG